MSFSEDLKEFNARYGMAYDGPSRKLPKKLDLLRERRLGEEFKEVLLARAASDYVQYLDGLVDLCYIAIGTAILHGWDFDEAWRRVHEANMKKERAHIHNTGKYNNGYDIVKPIGWQPPDLRDLVYQRKDKTND
jgi:predicted HAD superfamily Cof-like phosphohydrolase